jgi:DNA-binding NarL/FixJ family response regulator
MAWLKLATGLEFREIADRLGISYRTVKRATATLREALKASDELPAPGPIPRDP